MLSTRNRPCSAPACKVKVYDKQRNYVLSLEMCELFLAAVNSASFNIMLNSPRELNSFGNLTSVDKYQPLQSYSETPNDFDVGTGGSEQTPAQNLANASIRELISTTPSSVQLLAIPEDPALDAILIDIFTSPVRRSSRSCEPVLLVRTRLNSQDTLFPPRPHKKTPTAQPKASPRISLEYL